jgi:hypothetical protein
MIQVKVRGADEFQRNIMAGNKRLADGIRSLMDELADDVADEARRRAKRGSKTGRAAGSIRAVGPVVRAGDDVPWYGFADMGGRVGRNRSISRPFIKGGRYLFPAVRDVGVIKQAETLVDKVTKDI